MLPEEHRLVLSECHNCDILVAIISTRENCDEKIVSRIR